MPFGLGLPELVVFLLLVAFVSIILFLRSKRKAKAAHVTKEKEEGIISPNPRKDTKLSNRNYNVFISYRRESGSESARSIRAELQQYNLHIFLDVDDLHSGHFNKELLQCIADTPNFVVVLSPNSLDRCIDGEDWLRQEIAQAIKTKRNIIPILMPGFKYPERQVLPDDIRDLRLYQSITYSHDFFGAMIQKVKGYLQ